MIPGPVTALASGPGSALKLEARGAGAGGSVAGGAVGRGGGVRGGSGVRRRSSKTSGEDVVGCSLGGFLGQQISGLPSTNRQMDFFRKRNLTVVSGNNASRMTSHSSSGPQRPSWPSGARQSKLPPNRSRRTSLPATLAGNSSDPGETGDTRAEPNRGCDSNTISAGDEGTAWG